MWDEGSPVAAPPENQYGSAGRHCSFSLTPVDHMKMPFISSPAHMQAKVARQRLARDARNCVQMNVAPMGVLMFFYLSVCVCWLGAGERVKTPPSQACRVVTRSLTVIKVKGWFCWCVHGRLWAERTVWEQSDSCFASSLQLIWD